MELLDIYKELVPIKELVKRYTKKQFGLEFIPTNLDIDTLKVQVLILDNDNIVGQYTVRFEDIYENNKVGVLYLEGSKKVYLVVNYRDLPKYNGYRRITIKDLIEISKKGEQWIEEEMNTKKE